MIQGRKVRAVTKLKYYNDENRDICLSVTFTPGNLVDFTSSQRYCTYYWACSGQAPCNDDRRDRANRANDRSSQPLK